MPSNLHLGGKPVRGVWLGSRLQFALHRGGTKVWPPDPDIADDFTRADSTNLGSTPTGGVAWTEYNYGTGNMSISSNQLASSTGDWGLATVETGESDGVVAGNVTGDGMSGVIFRYVDYQNFWFWVRLTAFGNAFMNKVVNGTETTMANIALAGHEIVWVCLEGNNITYFTSPNNIDMDLAPAFDPDAPTGWNLGTVTDSTHASATKHGVILRESTTRGRAFRYWYPSSYKSV